MRILKQIGLYSSLSILLSSCAVRSVYVPTTQNVLLFDDKKQIQANAYVGSNHTELQLAANPIHHFSLGANTNYGTGLAIYEGFLGLYNWSKRNPRWRYEILGGGSYTNNFLQQNNALISYANQTASQFETVGLYNKYFIQPAVGVHSQMEMYKMSYSFSFSTRISYVDFKKYIYRELDVDNTQLQGVPIYFVNKEYHNKTLYLFEPCLTNKIGFRNIYIVLQLQFMMPYSTDIDIRYTKFSPVYIISAGLQYNLIFKSRKKKDSWGSFWPSFFYAHLNPAISLDPLSVNN